MTVPVPGVSVLVSVAEAMFWVVVSMVIEVATQEVQTGVLLKKSLPYELPPKKAIVPVESNETSYP